MRTSIARIGRVTLKRAPTVSVITDQPMTNTAEHLRKAIRYIQQWERGSMAGYALVTWDNEMAFRCHYHLSDSPIGGTAACSFVHDALLKSWIEAQQ